MGATAAWSKNAHRRVIGISSRYRVQSIWRFYRKELLLPMSGHRSTIECNPGGLGVFLFEPGRTQYDLNFRIFGVAVRIHPMFWLVTVIFGWNLQDPRGGLKYVLLWVIVVFISILIHELGHVFMGRFFGSDGHIVLYGFGGLAIGSNHLEKRWQRIAVSFAGPLAEFVLLGVVLLVGYSIGIGTEAKVSKALQFLYNQLVWVNSFWALVNLLPIWPLDGGMISRELFQSIMPESGTVSSLIASMLVAGTLVCFTIAAA